MLKYLNFFIHNVLFETIIGILFIINFFLINYLDLKNIHKELNNKNENDKFFKYKFKVTIFAILFIIAFLFYKFKNFTQFVLLFIIPFFALLKSILITYNNKNDFSLDNKYINICSNIIFLLFFSSNMTPTYLEIFANIEDILKEILLIIYLTIKIILFIFLLFINFFILFSNINDILKNKATNKLSDFFIYKDKNNNFIFYNFFLFKKYDSKKREWIDKIIFLILIIPTININLLYILLLNIKKRFLRTIYTILKYFEEIKNYNKIIKRFTNISIIISIIIVYIILILLKNYFNVYVVEIYEFISIIILLPMIYDSIK